METELLNHYASSAIGRHEVYKYARGINSGLYKKIVFLVGAGISKAAGYPLFRDGDNTNDDLNASFSSEASPVQLAGHLRAFAEIDPVPTEFHKLMHRFGHRIFTQNIDGLEINDGRTVWCHGSLHNGARCSECNLTVSWDDYKARILDFCNDFACAACGGDLRPNIVLYGEEVQFDMVAARKDLANADLIICAGTSLQVFPFASLLSKISIENPDATVIIIDEHITFNHVSLMATTPKCVLVQDDCQVFAEKCLFDIEYN